MKPAIRLFTFVFLAFVQGTAAAAAPPSDGIIRIGVTLGGHGDMHRRVFSTTREALESHFGSGRIDFRFLHTDVVSRKVIDGELDFYISTGGKSRRLMPYGSRDLLTMVTDRFPDPSRSYGGVFLVRKDSDARELVSLRGRTLVSNRPGGFFGFIAPMERLESEGFRHESFFRSVLFPDTDNRDVIRMLLEGKADAAAVPSCFLEDNYAPDDPARTELRPIGLIAASPCARSTPAYPNWTISTAPGVPHQLAREIVQVLLSVEPDEQGVRWSIATDFTQTDRLHLSLRTGIFENVEKWTFSRFLREYRSAVTLGALIFILLVLYSGIVNWMVKRRTAELSGALREQIRLQKAAREAESRFEALQKTGLIGQMSSMIAHELRQPLTAALAYIHGLQRYVDSGTLSKSETHAVLSKLAGQIEKADSIVDRVRAYARGQGAKKAAQPISVAVKAAADAFRASGRFQGSFTAEIRQDPVCCYSAMELELAILNLLRNAADSLNEQNVRHAAVRLTVGSGNGVASVTVTDNGRVLGEDDMRRMQSPLASRKKHGLGLGLELVRSIVTDHGGRLRLTPIPTGGLAAVITLPEAVQKELPDA